MLATLRALRASNRDFLVIVSAGVMIIVRLRFIWRQSRPPSCWARGLARESAKITLRREITAHECTDAGARWERAWFDCGRG